MKTRGEMPGTREGLTDQAKQLLEIGPAQYHGNRAQGIRLPEGSIGHGRDIIISYDAADPPGNTRQNAHLPDGAYEQACPGGA